MADDIFNIKQSELENAKNTDDSEWLEATFDRAAAVLAEGGKVHITQEFSDTSRELVAIIDSPDLLAYYKDKYSSQT